MSNHVHSRSRVPEGVTIGGQFATERRAESAVTLSAPPASLSSLLDSRGQLHVNDHQHGDPHIGDIALQHDEGDPQRLTGHANVTVPQLSEALSHLPSAHETPAFAEQPVAHAMRDLIAERYSAQDVTVDVGSGEAYVPLSVDADTSSDELTTRVREAINVDTLHADVVSGHLAREMARRATMARLHAAQQQARVDPELRYDPEAGSLLIDRAALAALVTRVWQRYPSASAIEVHDSDQGPFLAADRVLAQGRVIGYARDIEDDITDANLLLSDVRGQTTINVCVDRHEGPPTLNLHQAALWSAADPEEDR